jgi:hypothetical protein
MQSSPSPARRFALLILLMLLAVVSAAAQGGTVRVKRKVTVHLSNGDSVSGVLAQINSDEVQVDVGDTYKTIKLDDVVLIEFGSPQGRALQAAPPKVEGYQLAAVDAAQALRRLVSGTQVGLSLFQYNQLIVEVYETVSRDLALIPDGDIHDELAAAMDDYVFARNIWQASLDYDRGEIPTKSAVARLFSDRYRMGIKPKYGEVLKRDATLDYIWQSAAKHIVAALKLIQ